MSFLKTDSGGPGALWLLPLALIKGGARGVERGDPCAAGGSKKTRCKNGGTNRRSHLESMQAIFPRDQKWGRGSLRVSASPRAASGLTSRGARALAAD